jgi:hypothetical protein
MNKAEATKQNQSKPKLTKPKPKNLDADFCDSMKPNRNFADKRNAVEQKAENLKTYLLKKH